jgi:hypothetical protein
VNILNTIYNIENIAKGLNILITLFNHEKKNNQTRTQYNDNDLTD